MDKRPGILKVLHAVAGTDVNPAPDESLFSSGLLDSFALPEFVSGLEAAFSVPDPDLSARKFDTIELGRKLPRGQRQVGSACPSSTPSATSSQTASSPTTNSPTSS